MSSLYSAKGVPIRIRLASEICATIAILGLILLPSSSQCDEENGASNSSQPFNGLFDTGLFGDQPIAGQGQSSASATFYTGSVDRGQVHLPIKNSFSSFNSSTNTSSLSFTDAILDPQLSDASFYGWGGDVKIPMEDLGLGPCFCLEDPGLVFQWDFGRSSYQTRPFGIETSATNATSSLLLDPQGPGGGFGSSGYVSIPNIQYFADHENVWASSNYEEQLYAFGVDKVCYSDERLFIETMAAFIIGNTKEESVISGQTAIQNGSPNIDYRYENKLDTDRFGFQLGAYARYELGEIAGRSVGVYAGGEARYIHNDAKGSSAATVSGLVNYNSVNNNIEENWSDFGVVGSVGVEVELCPDATLTAGFQAESWSIGDLGTPAGESFVIREDDRVTTSAGIGVRVTF